MIAETIYWHQDGVVTPDDETTVMVETLERLDPGYLDGGVWHWANGEPIEGRVISWADMPLGSKSGKGGA